MLTSLIASLLTFGALSFQAASADDGHELTQLWKRYEVAEAGDQPVTQCEILAEIKEKAIEGHYIVDFYDAATLYVNVSLRRNWKLRDSLYEALKQEIADFGEPFLEYKRMVEYDYPPFDQLWSFASSQLDKIGANRTSHLWNTGCLDENLLEFVQDDAEYVLWDILGRAHVDYDNPHPNKYYQALEKRLAGRYPLYPFLRYLTATRLSDPKKSRAALEEHAAKYEGKAIALFSRQTLLRLELQDLEKEKSTPASAYKELYEKAKAFERDRAAFRGDEAKIAKSCTYAEGLIETLTSKDITVKAGKGEAMVYFRNLDKASLQVRKSEAKFALFTKEVINPVGSFYVLDSVKVELPALEDGSYMVEANGGKDIMDSFSYDQFRLSSAIRWDAGGFKIYVADYKTGKPLSRATLILKKADKVVLTESAGLSDVFTALPSRIAWAVKNNPRTYYTITAEAFDADGKAMRSLPVSINYSSRPSVIEELSADSERGMRANIYRDQGAYRPGDTLRFKAVVFKGSLEENLSVVSGRNVTVRLYDTESKQLGALKLKTNSFGSVSGEFVLPSECRGGYFMLGVRTGNDNGLGTDFFRVDEYQLPTFTLSFDKKEELYLPGQEINISGKVTSYSGHPLSGARLSAVVTRYGDTVARVEPELGDDGSFSFSFSSKWGGYHNVEVTVLDSTGETLSFNTGRYVSDSFSIYTEISNSLGGNFTLSSEATPVRYYTPYRPYYSYQRYIVEDDVLSFTASVHNTDGITVPMDVSWAMVSEKKDTILTGTASSGKPVSADISSLAPGLYTMRLRSEVSTYYATAECLILKLEKDADNLPAEIRYLMIPGKTELADGESIDFRLGTSDGEQWVVVSLFGKDYQQLETRSVYLEGKMGESGSLKKITLPYKSSYPDAVALQLFFFKDGSQYYRTQDYTRKYDRLSLPLEFTSFKDMTRPGTEYTFSLKSQAGVEALAAVYDKSIDAIQRNEWEVIVPPVFRAYSPYVNTMCGGITDMNSYNRVYFMNGRHSIKESSVAIASSYAMKADLSDEISFDTAQPMAAAEGVEESEAQKETEDVTLREMFSTSLTFQPHLLSDANGNLSFTFRTSDKLSTYYVAVYAHDKKMKNALVRQETVVTIPVKVSLVQPAKLYGGDSYTLSANVSSISDEPVSGNLYLYVYPSADYESGSPLSIVRIPVELAPHAVENRHFDVDVPADVEALGFKLVFVADGFSDGVFVSVPVAPAVQTLTESHSAVYHYGDDKAALEARLRGEFVNADGASAILKEVSLLDMVKDAIPSKADPSSDNVIDLSEAWYVRLLASSLGADFSGAEVSTQAILAKILACRNADGGFGWFEGMNSSAIITAVLLERFAAAAELGVAVPDMRQSVKYLDNVHFINTVDCWRGGLSDEQYMYVRSLYASVPFDIKPESKAQKKVMTEFKKTAKAYLTPSGKRGLTGAILAKARRVRTLENLTAGKDGIALAKEWGITLSTGSKLEKSLNADIVSLLEYAVEHRDGGWYYPNAVMPWRGLLESEAYAHAMLCNILSHYPDTKGPEVANGLRIWLMLQKESQKWGSDPGFVEALAAVLRGPESVLSTSVIALSAQYTKPFNEIKASGNGFSIERVFYRVTDSGREEIAVGDTLQVGEKIIASYKIWNQENRSFVTLTAEREASLRPENQLSGYYGWRNIRYYATGFGFTPQGYRHVKSSSTVYYFDIFPEEKVTVEETMFVTQAGRFSAPVVSIESTYAPAYRANDGFHGPLVSAFK